MTKEVYDVYLSTGRSVLWSNKNRWTTRTGEKLLAWDVIPRNASLLLLLVMFVLCC